MLLNSLKGTGHPHNKELLGPNVDSVRVKKLLSSSINVPFSSSLSLLPPSPPPPSAVEEESPRQRDASWDKASVLTGEGLTPMILSAASPS